MTTRKYRKNCPIYHHRWLFVKDAYEGFDVDKDFMWSQAWSKVQKLNSKKYGRKNHWKQFSLPRIFKTLGIISIQDFFLRERSEKGNKSIIEYM